MRNVRVQQADIGTTRQSDWLTNIKLSETIQYRTARLTHTLQYKVECGKFSQRELNQAIKQAFS